MKNTMYTANKLPITSNINTSLAILLWLVILTQRIAIKISGYQFSAGMIVFFIFLFFWWVTKKLYIIQKRLVFFLVALCGILISAWVSSAYSNTFSIPSLLLLIGLYFLSIFTLRTGGQIVALKHFRTIMLISSLVGIFQFLTQLIGISFRDWLDFFPAENILENYNYAIPVSYGINLYKSNGIVFSEPSFFSQLISLAAIIEVYYFHKYWRLLILLPALLLSFSGTGIFLLAIGLLPLIFSTDPRKWNKIVAFGSILLFFLILFSFSGLLPYTYSRISEFQSPGASGYIRFISPIISYNNFFLQEGNTAKLWFGLGPGVSEDYQWNPTIYPNTIMKLLAEYGIAGLLFFSYLVYIFFSGQPFWLSLSMFVMYALLGSLLIPQIVVLYYVILILHRKSKLLIQG